MRNSASQPLLNTEIKHRIEAFQRKFGEKHLILAQHAALPLALNPQLLYKIWAIFRRDIYFRSLEIPWIAVSDLLLSGLCREIGYELYEMNEFIRDKLLTDLQNDENFGKQRIEELAYFLNDYISPTLQSQSQDIRDFSRSQRWVALAYIQPEEAARELALSMSKSYQIERNDMLRIISTIKALSKPLKKFPLLSTYAQGMEYLIQDNVDAARIELLRVSRRGKISGIKVCIPKVPDRHNDIFNGVKLKKIFRNLLQHLVKAISLSSKFTKVLNLTKRHYKYLFFLFIFCLPYLFLQFWSSSFISKVVNSFSINSLDSEFPIDDNLPMDRCGDPDPAGIDTWYPVYVNSTDITDRNNRELLAQIKTRYCSDAFLTFRDDIAQYEIQVASFRSRENAQRFVELMTKEFGNSEIGPPSTH